MFEQIEINKVSYLLWNVYGKFILSERSVSGTGWKRVREFITESEAKNYINLIK